MADFKSYRSYESFANKITHSNRYIRDPETEEFLATLLEKAKDRRKGRLLKGRGFWRAQIGHCWREISTDGDSVDVPRPFPNERISRSPARHVRTGQILKA